MRKETFRLLPLLTFLLYLLTACSTGNLGNEIRTSEVYGSSNFAISAESTGTTAEGSIVLYEKDDGDLGVKLLASINIGDDDWGGVAFYLPQNIVLSDVICTYPEEIKRETKQSVVDIWRTDSGDTEYTTGIEIGRSREFIARGGKGIVIIEATLNKVAGDKDLPEGLHFAIECGGKLDGDKVIWGIGHDEITVNIHSDIE